MFLVILPDAGAISTSAEFLYNFISFFNEISQGKPTAAPTGTLHSVASHLRLYCLPLSHKKDARLT